MSDTLFEHYDNNPDSFSFGNVACEGQTFTPQAPHKITSIKCSIYRNVNPGVGNINVNIYACDVNHLPTGPSLCSGSYPTSSLPYQVYQLTEIILGAGAYLSTGVEYCFTVDNLEGASTFDYYIQVDAADGYARGTYIRSGNGGSTWYTEAWDMYFAEYGLSLLKMIPKRPWSRMTRLYRNLSLQGG